MFLCVALFAKIRCLFVRDRRWEDWCDFAQADVNKAVAAAQSAFHPGSEWRSLQPSRRAVLMNKVADLLERDRLYVAVCNIMLALFYVVDF